MKTFVIAEAGSCHDGEFRKAITLVKLAREIGADACKFQWLSSAERLCERRNAPGYLAAYKLIEFPREWLGQLKGCCDALGVEFMCSTYLYEDVPVIAPLVQRFKIASFEAADGTFFAIHRAFKKPIVVSTGMQGGDGTAKIQREDPDWSRMLYPGDAWLHCVSAYPAPVEDANLRVIRRLGFGGYDADAMPGLSDHTRHPWTGALAVAAGARMVEFHVRLDETDPANADYAVARDPREAADYIANIRLAEAMLGDGVKRVMPSEEPMLRYRVKP